MTMVCARVIGNHTTVTVAGMQGHLELNVFKPVLIHALLQSIRLLGDAAVSFADHCVIGIEANQGNIDRLLGESLMLVTALAPEIGYDAAARAAKKAHHEGLTLKQAVLELKLTDGKTFDRLVDPRKMLGPARTTRRR